MNPVSDSARGGSKAVARLSLFLAATVVLGGCTTVKGWFGDKKGDGKPNEPMALSDITPTVAVAKLWSANAGKGEGRMGLGQRPAIADGRVYAAAVEGGVRAFDLQSGQLVWKHETKKLLTGGPGAADGLVVVGGLDGEVIALDAASGEEKWQAKVTGEVVAPPAVGQGMVFIRSNDGRVTALNAATGDRRWFWNHDLPTLTLRGNDGPTLGPGVLFVGNDDGTLTTLAMPDGRPLWQQTVGEPEGRTELDRMADVDGAPLLDGTTIYATSYKQQTIAIDGPSGRPMWTSDHGGAGSLGNAPDRLVVSSPNGTVYALDKANGNALWQQPGLARRNLTAPAVQGDYAVVGDYDGYLHWLRLDTGEFAARARMGGKKLRATPVVADGILVAQNVDGELTAFRLGQ